MKQTDLLSAQTIRQALTTRVLGHPTLFFEQVGSTNDVVHERAAAGAAEGLLVVADEQTAGRGRLDRSWWAPPGSSLLISLLLRPPIPPNWAGQLTMCLGLGAVEGIEEATALRPSTGAERCTEPAEVPVEARGEGRRPEPFDSAQGTLVEGRRLALKWPNDLLLGGRKLGGMLSELRMSGDKLEYAVLGLGLNVNQTELPSDLASVATSLRMTLGRPVDRLSLLVAILKRCEVWYERLLSGTSPHEAWAARLDTLGRHVTITTAAGILRGLAIAVTPEGALLVRDQAERVHTIWSGDVTAVRNTPTV